MTAPTDFEKRLIELNLTYAQIELVKQAVEEIVIGDDLSIPPMSHAHTIDGRVISGVEVQGRADIVNNTLATLRKRVRG